MANVTHLDPYRSNNLQSGIEAVHEAHKQLCTDIQELYNQTIPGSKEAQLLQKLKHHLAHADAGYEKFYK